MAALLAVLVEVAAVLAEAAWKLPMPVWPHEPDTHPKAFSLSPRLANTFGGEAMARRGRERTA